MTFVTSPDDLYKSVPVVAFERNVTDLWKTRNISPNSKQFGIFTESTGEDTDILSSIYTDDQELVTRKLGAAILQQRSGIDLRYRIRTGSFFRWVEEQCSLSYNESGEIISAYSYLWMSSLPVEWALLTKGSEVWNTLNSKIRHDILNQLTAILGYLELSTDIITDPMLIDFSKKEQNAAEKIRNRLIFTREYQKIGLLEFSWISLSDIISEALNEILLGPIRIKIETNQSSLYVDKNFRVALEKILENIPVHATGATDVIIQLRSTDEGGLLSIEDNGCGISEQHKARIFDLGFGNGNGAGLFLSEKLLSVFGITIHENGIPGQGARFELFIPSPILNFNP